MKAQDFVSQFKALPAGRLPGLEQARAEAIARFAERGFPGVDDEEWRFTPLDGFLKASFVPAPASRVQAKSILAPFAHRLVFVNGRFSAEQSSIGKLPEGAFVGSIASAPGRLEPYLKDGSGASAFSRLNTAFFDDGAAILLPAGASLEPVHLFFVTEPAGAAPMAHVRVLVCAEAGASIRLVEEYASSAPGAYFTNAVTDVVAGENSSVEHFKLQRESSGAFHVSSLRVRQARDSRFAAHSFGWGGGLVRNDVRVSLDGEGAQCDLNGLYLASGSQHVDNHTFIEHLKPHGVSRELYKGVLDGKARAVFNGAIEVAPQAQKTNALVYNKNLLLSDDGLVNTKPEFKIHANDVQCKHGATIGQLSGDALFYLRSRGIGEEEARRLLVYAFAGEMASPELLAPVRDAVLEKLAAWLPEAAHA